jgi:hypothetical protein
MDDRTRQNWEKVRLALEATGKTDSFFYRRAVAILKTGRDPEDSPAPNKI